MRNQFDEQLHKLNTALIEMGATIEYAIEHAAKALVDRDVNLAREVIQFEKKTERMPVVACMGLAFKPDIDDLRESPAKYIVSRIIAESRADVLVVEPNIKSHKSFNLTDFNEAYNKADIVVWLVRHKQFLTVQKQEGKIELDFCGLRK